MEYILSLISIGLIIYIYFSKKTLMKPILFCFFGCINTAILFNMGKPEIALITLSLNVFMTGLFVLISLHFSKYNHDVQSGRKSYELLISTVVLTTLFGIFILVVDRNFDSFVYGGEDRALSMALLESSIINNNLSIMLLPLMMMIISIALVFMFRKERIK